jgi:hypothetical protein
MDYLVIFQVSKEQLMMHIVDFNKYCRTCKYSDLDGQEDPCNECLHYPVKEDSRKPVNYTEDGRNNESKRSKKTKA